MSFFYLGCACLVLLSACFYLWPSRRRSAADGDLREANVDWYRLRSAELENEEDVLRDEAKLRLLEDEVDVRPPRADATQPIPSGGSADGFPTWLLLPLVALLSTGLYYYLGAWPDVVITRQLDSLNSASGAVDVEGLISQMERRSKARPDNLHYRALLARHHMEQGEFAQAAQLYDGLAQVLPSDAYILAAAAQSDYLANNRTLNDAARLRAEQALAADPQQRTALGLLGMASFEQQDFRAAIHYWERLVAVEPPGTEGRALMMDVIARARENLGLDDAGRGQGPASATPAPASASSPDTASVPGDGVGVTVRMLLPPGVQLNPGHTVFVLARDSASGSRMPIAVQRFEARNLPAQVRLDDSNSMAGRKLSATAEIVVAVQVSVDGRPGEASARWLGESAPIAPSAGAAVAIEMRPGPAKG